MTILSRVPEDELLLLASDGLWDVMSNQVCSWSPCPQHLCALSVQCCDSMLCCRSQSAGSDTTLGMALQEVCSLAQRCLRRAQQRGASRHTAAKVAASVLTRAAIDQGSSDNVTVVVVDLSRCAALLFPRLLVLRLHIELFALKQRARPVLSHLVSVPRPAFPSSQHRLLMCSA